MYVQAAAYLTPSRRFPTPRTCPRAQRRDKRAGETLALLWRDGARSWGAIREGAEWRTVDVYGETPDRQFRSLLAGFGHLDPASWYGAFLRDLAGELGGPIVRLGICQRCTRSRACWRCRLFGQPTPVLSAVEGTAIPLRELLAGPPTDFVSQDRTQYDEPLLSALAVAWALDTLDVAYTLPLMYVSQQVDGNPSASLRTGSALVQLTLADGHLVHLPVNESPFLANGGVNGDRYLCGLVGDTASALAWQVPDALPFDVPEREAAIVDWPAPVVERSYAS